MAPRINGRSHTVVPPTVVVAPVAPAVTEAPATAEQVADTATMSDILAQLDALRSENARLKANKGSGKLKVSEKGAVSLYGEGRWPITLYAEQWQRVLAQAPEILAFIETNKAVLKHKATEDDEKPA